MHVVERYYAAFERRDPKEMGACYADDARFSDPVFPELDARGVRAMWTMLLSGGTDLRIRYTVLEQGATSGRCRWEAWYTFRRTGRPVHNVITSTFHLRSGLIVAQQDRFDLWRWSRQALGWKGVLLGWSPLVRKAVRTTAAQALAKQLGRENEAPHNP